jgi:UDP-N-acetylglucosamine/UDP-N-acetyl-alpha-D-glucosaminouronate 4-epimerase
MVKQGTRVLVTGGAGFLGSHVTRTLAAAGCQVRVLDDLSTGKRERLTGVPHVDFLHADVRNAGAVGRAARGANAIVHLAQARVGDDPLRAQEVNLAGTLNVLAAARAADKSDRPRIVLASSGAVYGKQSALVLHEELQPRPATPEAVMALAIEGYARVFRESYHVPVQTLRLFRVFGPDEDAERPDASVVARFIRAALDGTSPIIHGDGQQTRDVVYVDNVVAAIVAALERDIGPDALNVASGEAVTINFLWTLVLELAGKRRMAIDPTYIPAPPWEAKTIRPQIARACKALGWAPSVRLRDGLSRTVSWAMAARSSDPNAWFTPKDDATPEPRPAPTRPRGMSQPAIAVAQSQSRIAVAQSQSRVAVAQSQSRIAVGSQPKLAAPPPPPPQAKVKSRPEPRPKPEPKPEPKPLPRLSSQPQPLPRLSSQPQPPAPRHANTESAARVDESDLEVEWAPVPALPGLGR